MGILLRAGDRHNLQLFLDFQYLVHWIFWEFRFTFSYTTFIKTSDIETVKHRCRDACGLFSYFLLRCLNSGIWSEMLQGWLMHIINLGKSLGTCSGSVVNMFCNKIDVWVLFFLKLNEVNGSCWKYEVQIVTI